MYRNFLACLLLFALVLPLGCSSSGKKDGRDRSDKASNDFDLVSSFEPAYKSLASFKVPEANSNGRAKVGVVVDDIFNRTDRSLDMEKFKVKLRQSIAQNPQLEIAETNDQQAPGFQLIGTLSSSSRSNSEEKLTTYTLRLKLRDFNLDERIWSALENVSHKVKR